MNKLFISEELESCLVGSALRGTLSLDLVPTETMTPDGQAVMQGAAFLAASGVMPPFSKTAIISTASDIAGGDKVKLRPYVDKAMKDTEKDAGTAAILQKLHEQQALTEIMNSAQTQLAARTFDPSAFTSALAVKKKTTLAPASTLLVNDTLPPMPTGYPVRSLPALTKASGGIMGVWALGGKAKAGKSTLGVQLSLDVSVPVLYYDMENGEAVLMYRIGKALGGDVALVRRKTERFYIRRNIQTLEADLASVPAPALVVVDSIQKLPTKLDQRRTGLDAWLLKFERLKERGYHVLLISEVNGFGGYKETGEVEYTVDFGLQIQRDDDGQASLRIVANRHRPDIGDLCYLERVNDWWWKETDDLGTEEAGL